MEEGRRGSFIVNKPYTEIWDVICKLFWPVSLRGVYWLPVIFLIWWGTLGRRILIKFPTFQHPTLLAQSPRCAALRFQKRKLYHILYFCVWLLTNILNNKILVPSLYSDNNLFQFIMYSWNTILHWKFLCCATKEVTWLSKK